MAGDRDYSEMTYEEWVEIGKKRPSRGARLNAKEQSLSAARVFQHDRKNHAILFDDEYTFPDGAFPGDLSSARSQVFSYMWYRQMVLDDGGTPTDFTRG